MANKAGDEKMHWLALFEVFWLNSGPDRPHLLSLPSQHPGTVHSSSAGLSWGPHTAGTQVTWGVPQSSEMQEWRL